MARVHLKIHASLGGKDYRVGTHDLPDAIVKDWYFQALVKSGKAELFDAKSAKKMAESATPAPSSSSRPLEDGVTESSDESDDEIIEDESDESEVEDFLEESEDSEEDEKPKLKKKTKKKSSKK